MSNFPSKSSENSRTIFQGRVQSVTGLPTTYVVPSNPNVVIPTDNDGSNPDYTLNFSYLYVYRGGVIQYGWAIDSYVEYGCSHTSEIVSDTLFIRITNVLANTGYIQFTLTKAGESPLIAIVNYSKLFAGATGPTGLTGSTGDTGAQGIQGPAGNDGGGMVIQKYTIEVEVPDTPTVSDNGGFLRLTYSSAHNLSLGEKLHVFNAVFNEYGEVTTVVSTLIVDTDIAYQSGAKDVRKMRHFAQDDNYGVYNGNSYQILDFTGIIPVGSKLQELHFAKISGGSYAMQLSAGVVQRPTSGWNQYMDQLLLTDINDIESYIFPSVTGSYIILTADPLRNIMFSANPYYTNWETGLTDAIFELHISYIAYP